MPVSVSMLRQLWADVLRDGTLYSGRYWNQPRLLEQGCDLSSLSRHDSAHCRFFVFDQVAADVNDNFMNDSCKLERW